MCYCTVYTNKQSVILACFFCCVIAASIDEQGVWQHQCFPDIMKTMQHIHSNLDFFDRWRPQFIMHFRSIITVLITIGTSSSVLWHSWMMFSSVIAALASKSASEFFLWKMLFYDLEELGKTNHTCRHCRYPVLYIHWEELWEICFSPWCNHLFTDRCTFSGYNCKSRGIVLLPYIEPTVWGMKIFYFQAFGILKSLFLDDLVIYWYLSLPYMLEPF